MGAMVNGATPCVDAGVPIDGTPRATAHVADADFRLRTSSSAGSDAPRASAPDPRAPVSAAASATEPVATAARTTRDG